MSIEHNRLKELALRALEKLNFSYTEIVYPPDPSQRSVDVVASKKQNKEKKVLVKITSKLLTRSREFNEFRRLSRLIPAKGVVITYHIGKDATIEDVVHIRNNVVVVHPKTLEDFAKGDKVFIYEQRGFYYVKIDGMKLRMLREKHGMGMSSLAKLLGLSTKTLYQYEQGKMDMTINTAERFLEVFGEEFEDVVASINIFEDDLEIRKSEGIAHSDDSLKELRESESTSRFVDEKHRLIELIVKKAIESGIKAEKFFSIPSDIVVSHEKPLFMIVETEITKKSQRNIDENLKTKCLECLKMARVVDGKSVVVIQQKDPEITKELEQLTDVLQPEDIEEIFYEIKKR